MSANDSHTNIKNNCTCMQWLGVITPAREHSLAVRRIMTRMVIKLLNMNSVLQSASFRLLVEVIPKSAAAAAEDEEPLLECAVNKVTTIPNIFRISFDHREMVHDITRLFDSAMAQNSWVTISSVACIVAG